MRNLPAVFTSFIPALGLGKRNLAGIVGIHIAAVGYAVVFFTGRREPDHLLYGLGGSGLCLLGCSFCFCLESCLLSRLLLGFCFRLESCLLLSLYFGLGFCLLFSLFLSLYFGLGFCFLIRNRDMYGVAAFAVLCL